MRNNRFDEQEARGLTVQAGAVGWCQYENEKPEHGYLVLASLTDGTVRALDRQGWEMLNRLGHVLNNHGQ